MAPLKARVTNGRLLLDEPTDLPEGAEVDLVPVEGWDELDEEERQRLLAALDESDRDVAAGRLRPAADVLAELQRQLR